MNETQKKAIEKYKSTKKGRASNLLASYNHSDSLHNRGKGDLTAQWIVDNIFSKPCAHCGETDWHKIGCNRLDNSKPHTMDNVEPCCWECNNKLKDSGRCKTVYQYTVNDELVKIWSSLKNAATQLKLENDCSFITAKNGISCCCIGRRWNKGKWEKVKTYKGYKWSYDLIE